MTQLIISIGLFPPRSSDLTMCSFYYRMLKDKQQSNNCCTGNTLT